MKILFVCTGNSCRSAMARGYLEKRLKDLGKTGIEAFSAGVAPLVGMCATEEARQVIMEEGGDISGHYARKITELSIREADLIFVMERAHRQYILGKDSKAANKTYLLKDFQKIGNFELSDDPDIKDPIGKDINFYKEAFSTEKALGKVTVRKEGCVLM